MKSNLKFTSIIIGIVFLGLIYSGDSPAYAHPSDNWVNSNFPYTPNYVDTTIKIDCTNYGGDTDGDGICNNWENSGTGLHISFTVGSVTYTYDKGCDTTCPSANTKDVYLELDWMTGHDPDSHVIPDVIAAFAAAPTPGGPVRLHIQYGETSTSGDVQVHQSLLKVSSALSNSNPGFWVLKQNRFGTQAERNIADPSHNSYCANGESAHNCLTAKRQVFHYMVFIHQQSETAYQTSSGWSEIGGNDAVVSLGSFINNVGSIDNQEATLMHELGHNLNLYHGGGTPPDLNNPEHDNCKPNYLSIMSYTYQFRSTNDVCRPLDYSRSNTTPVLTEGPGNTLSDSILSSYRYPNPDPDPPGGTSGTCNNSTYNNQERRIYFENPSGGTSPGKTASNPPVDWNMATNTPYQQDINNLSMCTGTSAATYTTLTGHDDWNGPGINFPFIQSAKGSNGNNTSTQGRTGGSPSCNNELIGDIELPDGSQFDSKKQEILAKYGGSVDLQGSGQVILIPSVYDPKGNLTAMAYEMGGKFVQYYPTTKVSQDSSQIPILEIPPGQGNPNESACTNQDEITSVQVKNVHANQILELKQALTELPKSVFKDSTSSDKLQGHIEKAITDNNDDSPWKVVNDLNLIKIATDGMAGGDPSDDIIVDKDAQVKIFSQVQENLDRFVVEGTVTDMSNSPPAPTLTAIMKDDMKAADLTWNEPQYFGPVVAGYKIERNYNDMGFVTIEPNTHSDSTKYIDNNLQCGNSYSYRVTAITTFGVEGSVSNESKVKFDNCGGLSWAWIILIIIIAILIIIIFATI